MACPHVAAVVALVHALRIADGRNKLTPEQIKAILTITATDLGNSGYDEIYGYGLINASAAIDEALTTP